jgi:hypothetical protein
MHPDDLAQKCINSIHFMVEAGLNIEEANIMITTPKGWKAPPRFPRGQIVQWKEDGSRIRYLPAAKTLAWLAGNGLAKVELKSLKEKPK